MPGVPYGIKSSNDLRANLVRPARPRGWISAVLLGVASMALAACSAPAEPSTLDVGSTQQAIFSGTVDDDAQESAGVVSLKIGNGTSFELCSGSLLSPNVVLTARHCVSKSITSTVSCNELGQSGNGDHVGDDESLDQVHVYSGPKPAYGGEASAGIRQIVHAEGSILCNADIALLVLDREITDTVPLRVRLGGAPQLDEAVRAVGYGQNDRAVPVGTRLRKDAVKVLAVGQRVSASQTPLGSHEFEVGLSICQGDSGGPAISEATGAVIGVVSRGGDCTDDFGHIYTTTAGYAGLIARAFQIAGGAPLDEASDPANPVASADTEAPPASTHGAQGCAAGGAAPDADTFAWLAALGFAAGLVGRRRRRA
jgi:MYXO-CTERM domain-containing protein